MSNVDIDLIQWSDEQEDTLRALFDTFDHNRNGMLELPELREMLTLLQQVTCVKDTSESFTKGQRALLAAAIETMTTFSITTGVNFSEFIHFYNSMQEIGFELKDLKDGEDISATDKLIDDLTEDAINNATNGNNEVNTGIRFERTRSEKERWYQKIESRRDFLHKQILKRETTHKDLVPNRNPDIYKNEKIDYITLTAGADALRHAHNAHYKVELSDEIAGALKEHFDDLQEQGVVSIARSDFAKTLVNNRDLTAIFAFYKFAHNDVALNKYLEFKFNAIQKNKKLIASRKDNQKYLLERAASYERFLNERKVIMEEAMKKKTKSKPKKQEATIEETKTKKNRKPLPRWAVLYEIGLKRIQAVKAFEGKK
eukprot:g5617.t1